MLSVDRCPHLPYAVLVVCCLLALVAGCGAPTDAPEPPPEPTTSKAEVSIDAGTPRLRVLGTAQDGGFPHAACSCDLCERARRDPQVRRRIASLALVLPESGSVLLVDATPDIREQLDMLPDFVPPTGRVNRSPVDGVLLTHAHLGHYTGLGFFGFEAVHTRELPVYCTRSMASFLRENGPWSQLVRIENISLHEIADGQPMDLPGPVRVVPLRVPHRDEFADTVGFRFEGPNRSVLYIPDTDGWDAWESAPETWIAGVDVALLDGTFFSMDELPGRDVSSIGHPLIRDSMERFASLVAEGKQILFTHLNHSNPALDPDGGEREEIERRGYGVLGDGQEISL